MNLSRSILFISALLCFVSCVSIRPSTVQLSAEVGSRISEMERLHQLAIQRYFEMEEEKVEDFLTNTWEPLFLENFLGISGALDALQNVAPIDDRTKNNIRESIAGYLVDKSEAQQATDTLVRALAVSRKNEAGIVRNTLKDFIEKKVLDSAVTHVTALLSTDEPARIMMEFAEAAHEQMQLQRKEMMAPIQQARIETMAALSAAYNELTRGQSIITGRLEAAAKVTRQQDELLDKLGVSKVSEEITKKLSDFSDKVNHAISEAGKAINKVDKDNSSDLINTLKDLLNTAPAPSK